MGQRAFGDLDVYLVDRYPIGCHRIGHDTEDIGQLEVEAGEVDAKGDVGALGLGLRPLLAGQAHDLGIHPVYHLGPLELGHELVRTQEPILLGLPAGQDLDLADLAGHHADDGLCEGADLAADDSVVQVVHDIGTTFEGRLEALVEEA